MNRDDLKQLINEVLAEDIERGSLSRESQEKNARQIYRMGKGLFNKFKDLQQLKTIIEHSNKVLTDMKMNNSEVYDCYDEDILSDIEDVLGAVKSSLEGLGEFVEQLPKLETALQHAKEGVHHPASGPSFFGKPLYPASHRKPAIDYDVSDSTSITKYEQ